MFSLELFDLQNTIVRVENKNKPIPAIPNCFYEILVRHNKNNS